MNTSKQINVMIGLMFITFLILMAYLVNESNRADVEAEELTTRNAERGARTFVTTCRNCHGMEGEGNIGPPLATNAFLILGEDNDFGAEETPAGEAAAIRNYLSHTIECGRVGTFMPYWGQSAGGPLSDTQIQQLVTLITNQRWDLVEEAAEEADHEQFGETLAQELGREPTAEEIFERAREETLYPPEAAASLSITNNVCGQFTADEKSDFRSRDPFAAATEEPTETPSGTATATPPPSGEGENVAVELSEFAVALPDVQSASAGTITFNVANAGAIPHELVVIRSDAAPDALPTDASGTAQEDQIDVIDRLPEFPGGQSGQLTVDLEAGSYLLICNIPGHYRLGMTIAFTVE